MADLTASDLTDGLCTEGERGLICNSYRSIGNYNINEQGRHRLICQFSLQAVTYQVLEPAFVIFMP